MGRTGRKRNKKPQQYSQALDHEETVINLRKFMTRNAFNDPVNLKLRNFPHTGRGVATSKTLKENDIIIKVPYELIITFTTLQKANFLQLFAHPKLTIHDLLATFLAYEKHNNESCWRDYINSLPATPPWIPALLSREHIELLPVDLRLAASKTRRLLEESWSRVRKSMKGCVIDFHSFLWGYILVNTRAVYVEPRIIRELCDCESDILSDEPCMALCPFLDMFNHSDGAKTKAELIDEEGKFVFQLITLVGVRKHEQVFISYGDHDNVKLLMEYGFFIPGNCNDSLVIQSEDVSQVLGLNLSDLQYKYICGHGLDRSLFISETGPSFNLKAFLFIASGTQIDFKHLPSLIYNDDYPKSFLEKHLVEMCQQLLGFQLKYLEKVLKKIENLDTDPLIVDFLKYRKEWMMKLCVNK